MVSALPQQQHGLSRPASASLMRPREVQGANQPAHRRAPCTRPPLPLAGVHGAHTAPHPGLSLPFHKCRRASCRCWPSLSHRWRWATLTAWPGLWKDEGCVRGLGPPSLTLGYPGWPHMPSRLWTTSQDSPACGVHEEAQSHVCVLGPGVQNRAAPWEPGWATDTLGRLSLGPPELLVSLLRTRVVRPACCPLTASSRLFPGPSS